MRCKYLDYFLSILKIVKYRKKIFQIDLSSYSHLQLITDYICCGIVPFHNCIQHSTPFCHDWSGSCATCIVDHNLSFGSHNPSGKCKWYRKFRISVCSLPNNLRHLISQVRLPYDNLQSTQPFLWNIGGYSE